MAQTLQGAENLVVRTGTSKPVFYNQKMVGKYGRKKRGNSRVFLWVQVPLKFLSDENYQAFAMSQPLIDQLDSLEVDMIYITHAEQLIPFNDMKNGKVLPKDHPTFSEPRECDQRYVRVERDSRPYF